MVLVGACELNRQPVDQDAGFSPGSVGAPIRFATFNVSFFRESEGDLVADLSTADHDQARAVAEIVQRIRPQVLLLNEFDYDSNELALTGFRTRYLLVSQNGTRSADSITRAVREQPSTLKALVPCLEPG